MLVLREAKNPFLLWLVGLFLLSSQDCSCYGDLSDFSLLEVQHTVHNRQDVFVFLVSRRQLGQELNHDRPHVLQVLLDLMLN